MHHIQCLLGAGSLNRRACTPKRACSPCSTQVCGVCACKEVFSLASVIASQPPIDGNVVKLSKYPSDVLSITVGTLLGDGYIENRNGSCRYALKQGGDAHKPWLFWLHSFYSKHGMCNPKIPVDQFNIDRNTGVVSPYWKFTCFTSELFSILHGCFYITNPDPSRWPRINYLKVVPPFIAAFLTPMAIGAWVNDDGTVRNGSTSFCTDNFLPGLGFKALYRKCLSRAVMCSDVLTGMHLCRSGLKTWFALWLNCKAAGKSWPKNGSPEQQSSQKSACR